jgi:hypothetical protein
VKRLAELRSATMRIDELPKSERIEDRRDGLGRAMLKQRS